MFKRITIHLSAPICSCEKESLSWALPRDEKGRPCLKIICNICKTELFIPADFFVANFKLDTPYPGSIVKEKEEDKKEGKLLLFDGGKNDTTDDNKIN